MKKYFNSRDIISVFLIFAMLIQNSGCTTYKKVTSSELKDSNNYYCVIHAGKSKYKVDDFSVTNDTLTGRLIEKVSGDYSFRIYLASDSSMTISDDKTLSIPVRDITKVEKGSFDAAATVLCAIGVTLLAIITYGLIDIAISGFDINFEM